MIDGGLSSKHLTSYFFVVGATSCVARVGPRRPASARVGPRRPRGILLAEAPCRRPYCCRRVASMAWRASDASPATVGGPASPTFGGHCWSQNALKSAAVQPFHECTGVKVTTRPANHRCSERDRAPRQPAKTKKSSQSTQPQECNHATRQRREQHLRSHSQKKWTPSAAPTPTAPKLCRASRRASI